MALRKLVPSLAEFVQRSLLHLQQDVANKENVCDAKLRALLELREWLEEEKRGPKYVSFRDPLGQYEGRQDCMLEYLRQLCEVVGLPFGSTLTRQSSCIKCGTSFDPSTHLNTHHSTLTISSLVEGHYSAYESDHCPNCCPDLFSEK